MLLYKYYHTYVDYSFIKTNFVTRYFKHTDEGYLMLYNTWFCNWRSTMKNSYQAQNVIEEVIKEKLKVLLMVKL